MSTRENRRLALETGEWWWGGAVADGQQMPLGTTPHRRDLAVNAGLIDDPASGANQSAPLLVSSAGRLSGPNGRSRTRSTVRASCTSTGHDLVVDQPGDTLATAYRSASSRFFPASGRAPAEPMFRAPQYNTWIELPYHPTQQAVLDYARGVSAAGFPSGVIMIDDLWSVDYGNWTFDRPRSRIRPR